MRELIGFCTPAVLYDPCAVCRRLMTFKEIRSRIIIIPSDDGYGMICHSVIISIVCPCVCINILRTVVRSHRHRCCAVLNIRYGFLYHRCLCLWSLCLRCFCLWGLCFRCFCLWGLCFRTFCLRTFCFRTFCLRCFCLWGLCFRCLCLRCFCFRCFCLRCFCFRCLRLRFCLFRLRLGRSGCIRRKSNRNRSSCHQF